MALNFRLEHFSKKYTFPTSSVGVLVFGVDRIPYKMGSRPSSSSSYLQTFNLQDIPLLYPSFTQEDDYKVFIRCSPIIS